MPWDASTSRITPSHAARLADLVAEVDVAGGIDEIHDIAVPLEAHVLCLDRDTPLAFEIHRIEELGAHVARVYGARHLEETVGERRLPVVDMGDDAEAADAVEIGQGSHSRGWRADQRILPDRAVLPVTHPVACSGFRERFYVANIKSQKKRNLQNERRRERNKAVRSELKTRVKLATAAVESGAEDADALVQAAQKRLGKAGAKGIVHKNQAARRISRMMRRAHTTTES